MRAWRSSRDRVADASSRRPAATPSRRRCRHTRTLVNVSLPYAVHRNAGFSFLIFFVRRTRTIGPALTSRGRANLPIPSHYSYIRRAAAPSVIAFHSYIGRAIRAAFTSRCDFVISCVAQPSHLIESLLSVETSHYRAVRRGLSRTPAPLPCSLALFFVSLSVGLAASLEICSPLLLATL